MVLLLLELYIYIFTIDTRTTNSGVSTCGKDRSQWKRPTVPVGLNFRKRSPTYVGLNNFDGVVSKMSKLEPLQIVPSVSCRRESVRKTPSQNRTASTHKKAAIKVLKTKHQAWPPQPCQLKMLAVWSNFHSPEQAREVFLNNFLVAFMKCSTAKRKAWKPTQSIQTWFLGRARVGPSVYTMCRNFLKPSCRSISEPKSCRAFNAIWTW